MNDYGTASRESGFVPWRKAAAHGHVRSGGAGLTGVRKWRISLLGEGKLQGLTVVPYNASAKSVAAFETFVSVACCGLGLLMSPSVHQYTIGNSRLVLNGRKDTRIATQTRVTDQKPLACSNFASSHGGRVGALWTTFVDHSSRGGTKGASGG